MELYEGLLTRRSIRKYNPEKKFWNSSGQQVMPPPHTTNNPGIFWLFRMRKLYAPCARFSLGHLLPKMRHALLLSAQTKKNVSTAKKRDGTMPRLMVPSLRKTCCWPAMPKGWAPVFAVRRRCRWSLTTCVKSSVCQKRCSP